MHCITLLTLCQDDDSPLRIYPAHNPDYECFFCDSAREFYEPGKQHDAGFFTDGSFCLSCEFEPPDVLYFLYKKSVLPWRYTALDHECQPSAVYPHKPRRARNARTLYPRYSWNSTHPHDMGDRRLSRSHGTGDRISRVEFSENMPWFYREY